MKADSVLGLATKGLHLAEASLTEPQRRALKVVGPFHVENNCFSPTAVSDLKRVRAFLVLKTRQHIHGHE